MPHYEQLKARNNRISFRSYKSDGEKSTINLFKPIMIALSVIIVLAITFAIIKNYSANIKLNIRNALKKDKEIVDSLSINELPSTNLNTGYLSSFDNFRFLIQDDDNTNRKFSIDSIPIGSNKYITGAGDIFNNLVNTNNTYRDTITRENIEPFFNSYISNNNTLDNTTESVENNIEMRENYFWDNPFDIINTNYNTTIISPNIFTSSNNSESDSKVSKELPIESDYFNNVLSPRENKVVVNTMKPAYTPNKYRDEEYIISNNIEVEDYKSLSYIETNHKPRAKVNAVKVEERYTTKVDTNKKPVVIASENRESSRERGKEVSNSTIDNRIKNSYNTNYYVESTPTKNTIIINTLKHEDNKQAVNSKIEDGKNYSRETIKELTKDIPSKEYRKIAEYKLESIKKESADNSIKNEKYTTVITNSRQKESPTVKNTETIDNNTKNNIDTKEYEDLYNSVVSSNNKDLYSTSRIIRLENNNGIITEKNNNIEARDAHKENIKSKVPIIEREQNTDSRNNITRNSTIASIKKPENKNYIYLASFNENLNAITLIRKERKFNNNNISAIISTLLTGATDKENSENIFSAISKEAKLLDAYIDDTTLYINLSEEFEYNPLGSEGMIVAIYQIVYTATQFENIDSVIFFIDGKYNETIGSEGYIINKIFTRLALDYNILEEL